MFFGWRPLVREVNVLSPCFHCFTWYHLQFDIDRVSLTLFQSQTRAVPSWAFSRVSWTWHPFETWFWSTMKMDRLNSLPAPEPTRCASLFLWILPLMCQYWCAFVNRSLWVLCTFSALFMVFFVSGWIPPRYTQWYRDWGAGQRGHSRYFPLLLVLLSSVCFARCYSYLLLTHAEREVNRWIDWQWQ